MMAYGGRPKSLLVACLLFALALVAGPNRAIAAEPIKIGFAIAQSGALAPAGKAILVGIQMWAEDVNAKGGLLGRPLRLVVYDDQSNPANVAAIYTKLLDIDKVDLVISGYGTGIQAALMPLAIERRLLIMGTIATAVNETFHYNRFFQILPAGPDSKTANSKGFFDLAMTMNPKPKTVALVGDDVEFSQTQQAGARAVAKERGLRIVYDQSFPPNTLDLTPVVRSIKATNPEIVWAATYPPETVAIVRAARDVGLAPRIFGGGMVGLGYAALKTQLGPLLNGIVNFDYFVPVPTMMFEGTENFLKRYQQRAAKEGTDPLGYYVTPYGYAELQVLEQAIKALGSLDQGKLADYIRAETFKTIVGDVKFGRDGEWVEARILFIQYQNVTGNDIEQFRRPGTQIILYPPELKSGNFIYPYSDVERN